MKTQKMIVKIEDITYHSTKNGNLIIDRVDEEVKHD